MAAIENPLKLQSLYRLSAPIYLAVSAALLLTIGYLHL